MQVIFAPVSAENVSVNNHPTKKAPGPSQAGFTIYE